MNLTKNNNNQRNVSFTFPFLLSWSGLLVLSGDYSLVVLGIAIGIVVVGIWGVDTNEKK